MQGYGLNVKVDILDQDVTMVTMPTKTHAK